MRTEWFYKAFSLTIILVLFYLFYQVMSPFLLTIAWAVVLSITFYPLYQLSVRYLKHPWAASLITLLVILIVILGPFSYMAGSLVNEIKDVYSAIEDKGFDNIVEIQHYPRLAALFDRLGSYRMFEGIDLQQGAVNALKSLGSAIAERISGIFKNAVYLIINFIIMCLTLFFFLKDGNALAEFIKELLPFNKNEKERLVTRFKEMVIAAIYGGLAVGVSQGILGGIAFLFLGLPSPVFWGTAMALFSLVPLFGCAIIWVPAGVILLLSGDYVKGIGLLLYGTLIITSIDTIVKPILIGGRTKLHTLLVFFSVLGGIKYLGLLGFILGPLITALCLSLLEIYRVEEVKQQEAGG